MMSEKITDFRKKIEQNTNMSKVVPIKFPLNFYREFQEFSKEQSYDCYWLSIKYLLDYYNVSTDSDVKVSLLVNKLDQLEERLAIIEKALSESKDTSVNEVKTFGKV